MRTLWPVVYILVLTACFLCAQTSISGQAYLLPKAGWSMPQENPVIGFFAVDEKSGPVIGIELRSGRKPVYFNPGILFNYQKIEVYDTRVNGPRTNVLNESTDVIWAKLKVGVGVDLLDKSKIFNMHLRGGLSPIIALHRPDFKDIPDLQANYRKGYFEFHFGIGADIRKMVFDLDYHLGLVRNINTADIVQNTITLTTAIQLR